MDLVPLKKKQPYARSIRAALGCSSGGRMTIGGQSDTTELKPTI
jgi:hypothetical protein